MSSIVSQLIEAIDSHSEMNILIDQVAESLSDCVNDERLYSIPFSTFQKIISKTGVIQEETIKTLLTKALSSYSSLAYVLLPLIDCGNIGPQKALAVLAPLMDAPLLQQLKKIPAHAFEPKPAPQAPPQQQQQQNYRQNSYSQSRNQPQRYQQTRSQQHQYSNQYSNESIFDACEKGHLQRVMQILDNNPNQINSSNMFSDKPIHKAVWGIHPNIVKYLIDKGADVNCKDREGLTPLHKAILKKNIEIVNILIDNGADPSALSFNNLTPIFLAASSGNSNILVRLINAGGDLDTPSQYLDTPLHIAAKKGNAEIVMILCMQGADPNARNNRNQTPYDMTNDEKIKTMLIRNGYKPKQQNRIQSNQYQQQEEEDYVQPIRE